MGTYYSRKETLVCGMRAWPRRNYKETKAKKVFHFRKKPAVEGESRDYIWLPPPLKVSE
jgi:hypothetical protein